MSTTWYRVDKGSNTVYEVQVTKETPKFVWVKSDMWPPAVKFPKKDRDLAFFPTREEAQAAVLHNIEEAIDRLKRDMSITTGFLFRRWTELVQLKPGAVDPLVVHLTDGDETTWNIMLREGGSVCFYSTAPDQAGHMVHWDSADNKDLVT